MAALRQEKVPVAADIGEERTEAGAVDGVDVATDSKASMRSGSESRTERKLKPWPGVAGRRQTTSGVSMREEVMLLSEEKPDEADKPPSPLGWWGGGTSSDIRRPWRPSAALEPASGLSQLASKKRACRTEPPLVLPLLPLDSLSLAWSS
jgi:hypothetical protein